MAGQISVGDSDEAHVIPQDDMIEHEESEDCICMPGIEIVNEAWLYVHHSLDGRELQEPELTWGA